MRTIMYQLLKTESVSHAINALKAYGYANLRSALVAILTLTIFSQALIVPGAVAKERNSIAPKGPTVHSSLPSTVEALTVRHVPTINDSQVQGIVRQLSAENLTLSGRSVIAGSLVVPGSPKVTIAGHGFLGGTGLGVGSAQPAGYRVTIDGQSQVARLITSTDSISIKDVPQPSASRGARNVALTKSGQNAGNYANVRDLTVSGKAGAVKVPPGNYRQFNVRDGNALVLGVSGATKPSIYNLQSLLINGGSSVLLAGPVVLNVQGSVIVSGNSYLGASNHPIWLQLNLAAGDLTINENSKLYAQARAPQNNVTIKSRSQAIGSIISDSFVLTGNSSLTGVTGSLSSIAPTNGQQGQQLSVTLHGSNTQWLPGQTLANFGADVSVGGSAAAAFGPVTVIDATTAIADISISSTATLGPRTVIVQTPISGSGSALTETGVDAFTVAAVTPPGAATATVSTIAGTPGTLGFADGIGGKFNSPAGIAIGPNDVIYVADATNNRIRVVTDDGQNPGSFVVSTLAGNGEAGLLNGTGNGAEFNGPQGLAVDPTGVVYVADRANHVIRKITPDGTVTTFAGDGTAGYRDGSGSQARFNSPRDVVLDQQGNVYVADAGNGTVRLITPQGVVSTVAGDGTIGNSNSPTPRFRNIAGLATDGLHVFVYLADTGNHQIRRLDSSGTVITIAGNNIGFADGTGDTARFAKPSGIVIDASGNIIVADAVNSLIRQVTPGSSASTSLVTTLAGTGEHGWADGTGQQAQFFTPIGVGVRSTGAIIVSDTGNHILRQILVPPTIVSFNPDRAFATETITIQGSRFDGNDPTRNIVKFTRSAEAGGGQTIAQVTAASPTQLTVIVPSDATTGPVTVANLCGTATSPTAFMVKSPTPIVTGFSPTSGTVGTEVTIQGQSLQVGLNPTAVTFAGNGTLRLPALVSFSSDTELHATVPNGAVTGPIEITTSLGHTATAQPFVVTASQDFAVTVTPSAPTAVQGSSGTAVVFITSAQSTFSQVATLAVTGAPAGITAGFSPTQITAGANATLTLATSSTLATGSYTFNVTATAQIDGNPVAHTASVTLNVVPAGRTTLSGRVLSTENEPIMGATVSLDGKSTTTDAAGAFLLFDVNAGTDRPLMIDGRTASAPNRTYPVILEPANIVNGQANVVPFTFFLPPIDTQYEVEVIPGQNTVASNPRTPGLQMTIPAGANLRNRDGSPVARVSITPLPIDRTPAPLPDDVGTALVYTSQPGGAIADIAMPVIYPNLMGADPGTRVELYAFNHDTVQWYVYGYGDVSRDGRTIVPETDPTTGRPYGLKDFSWHFPNAAPGGNPGDPNGCPKNRTPNPVDLSTGVKIERETDIAFGGARGGLALDRIYTSDLTTSNVVGPFGFGTNSNYSYRLTGPFDTGGAGRLAIPEQVTGRLFSYARTDPDGTLIFTSSATTSQLSDVVRRLPSGNLEYRTGEGNVLRFNSSGILQALIDRNGNTTTLAYSGQNLTQITDAVGRSITLDYDSSNRIIRATDPLGRVWRYGYPDLNTGSHAVTTVTDPLNQTTQFIYDDRLLLSRIIDPRGNQVKHIIYSGNLTFGSQVIEQDFANGGFEKYDYTRSGRLITGVTITDSLGRQATKRFNALGYVISQTDSMGQTATIQRDITTNLPVSSTGPCGCTEATQQFDTHGSVTSTTDRLGQTSQFEYEPLFNHITKYTDKLGRQTTLTYDSRGNMVSLTNPLNQSITMSIDSFGQLVSITDALGHTITLEYDNHGNVTAAVDALGHRTTFEFDAIGRMIATVDALGRRSSVTLDDLDRVTSNTDASGAVTHHSYDADSNPISTTDALGRTWSAVYDNANRLTSTTDPSGRVVRRTYDTEDQLIASTSANQRVTRYAYDARGLLSTTTDPLGGIVSFTYDSRGNLTALSDQRGFTRTYTYDELSRGTSVRDPFGRASSVQYDAANNVIKTTDRLGRQVSAVYDNLDRPTSLTYADAVVNYSYDAAGRPTRIDDSQSSSFVQWAYDDANRLISESTPNGVVGYSYNNANQQTSMTAADRPPVTYDYDTAGRLNTIKQGTDTFTYGYDLLSRTTSLQRPNGITTIVAYDKADRLTRLAHLTPTNQPIEDYHYSYNDDGQITSISSLASASLLPAAQNLTPADAANRIAQLSSTTYSFDKEGQTTTKTDSLGTTQYQWDARGRLTSASLPSGQTVSYGYDAAGRRSSRTALSNTTNFLYDGADVVLDQNSGNNTEYLNAPGVDAKLRQSDSSGSLYFLPDHLGSTAALADSNGAVVEQLQYEPYGASAGSTHTRYDYTGRERDQLTGLMFNRARWYDPQQGHFLTEDPIGIRGGLNLYSYANNNPVSFSDPMGHSWGTALKGAAWGLAGGVATALVVSFVLTLSGPIFVVAAIGLIALAFYGGWQIGTAIRMAWSGELCPDDRDEIIGNLIGGLIGFGIGLKISPFNGPTPITTIGPIVPDPPYLGVEFVDRTGNPLGEFDRIEGKNFVEDKDGTGLNRINPKTGQPYKTPEVWAEEQVFDKTVTRIENLSKAVSTRPTSHGSPTVPSLAEIQGIRSLEFRVQSTDPGVQSAVGLQLQRLQARYPDWTFTVKYGK